MVPGKLNITFNEPRHCVHWQFYLNVMKTWCIFRIMLWKIDASILENINICPLSKKGNNIVHIYQHYIIYGLERLFGTDIDEQVSLYYYQ
jgi:hypothetical protein